MVETGGNEYQQEREQWDDGNNVVALEPGVVVAYERNTYTIDAMRRAGVEVVTIEGFELGKGQGRGALHDLSAGPRPALRERCRAEGRRRDERHREVGHHHCGGAAGPGLVAFARGDEHHRGDDVGTSATSVVSVIAAGGRGG